MIIMIICKLLGHESASARPMVEPGTEQQGSASLGVVVGSDPTTFITNPANLSHAEGLEMNSDISVLKINATYNHPVEGAFHLNIVAPPASAGIRYGKNSKWAIGLLVVPTGVGTKATFTGLPIDITATDSALAKVEASDTSVLAAAGFSYRITNVNFGLSVNYTHKSQTVKITTIEPEANIADASYSGSSIQPIAGLNSKFGNLRLGIAYAMGTYRTMSGKGIVPNTPEGETTPVHPVDYIPGFIEFGAAYQIKKFEIRVEFAKEDYSKGSSKQTTGMGEGDVKESNLKDVANYSISGQYKLDSKSDVTGGFSILPGNSGVGAFPGSGGSDNLGIAGPRFGQFENLDRQWIGLGYSKIFSKHLKINSQASYCKGHLSVPESTPGQGAYSLDILSLGAGTHWTW